MKTIQAAIYARVSSERQTTAQTIASQLAALRDRRRKVPAARAGSVNVVAGAPYASRYSDKHAGGGQARYEVLPDEARVVRQVFDWVGRDRLPRGEVGRRLTHAGERTRTGRTV